MSTPVTTERYAKVIEVSKRVRWEIERDLIRGRRFDYTKTFLPSYIFGLVERFIGAKVMDISRTYAFGDQVALEALVRMTDEEIKHQELFRRLEAMMAADMPPGYVMTAEPNAVAQAVLAAPTWSVLALTLDIELFTQAHFRASIEPDVNLSELWKDVFLFHWKEESQHAILDELEFLKEDAKLIPAERDAAVDGLIALVGAVDGILQAQAKADARYFFDIAGTSVNGAQCDQIHTTLLKAYRWQYIVSGVMEPRFQKVLFGLVDQAQAGRIQQALAPLTYAVPRQPEMPLPLAA